MPQASDEQRAEWGVTESEATKYLEEAGYTLTNKWTWIKPSKQHQPTKKELSAIQFLIDEWDFGGLEIPAQTVVEFNHARYLDKGEKGVLHFSLYPSTDQPAMYFTDPETGSPLCKASVALDDVETDTKLADDEIYIKTWSENEGILKDLTTAGIVAVRRTSRWQPGVVVCQVLEPYLSQMKDTIATIRPVGG